MPEIQFFQFVYHVGVFGKQRADEGAPCREGSVLVGQLLLRCRLGKVPAMARRMWRSMLGRREGDRVLHGKRCDIAFLRELVLAHELGCKVPSGGLSALRDCRLVHG